jgi:hypothetical protein
MDDVAQDSPTLKQPGTLHLDEMAVGYVSRKPPLIDHEDPQTLSCQKQRSCRSRTPPSNYNDIEHEHLRFAAYVLHGRIAVATGAEARIQTRAGESASLWLLI